MNVDAVDALNEGVSDNNALRLRNTDGSESRLRQRVQGGPVNGANLVELREVEGGDVGSVLESEDTSNGYQRITPQGSQKTVVLGPEIATNLLQLSTNVDIGSSILVNDNITVDFVTVGDLGGISSRSNRRGRAITAYTNSTYFLLLENRTDLKRNT